MKQRSTPTDPIVSSDAGLLIACFEAGMGKLRSSHAARAPLAVCRIRVYRLAGTRHVPAVPHRITSWKIRQAIKLTMKQAPGTRLEHLIDRYVSASAARSLYRRCGVNELSAVGVCTVSCCIAISRIIADE